MRSDYLKIWAQRRSVRAYTDDRIARATLERICTAARQAPSGANLQPGKFHILTGSALQALVDRLEKAQDAGEPISSEYSYFPEQMSCELKDRQRRAG